MESIDLRSLTSRDYVLVGAASIGFYTLNGAYSQSVCNIVTGILPAFFTYRMILEPLSTRTGYHAILFYWLLHGCLSASDQLVADSTGYFFGKFVLLCIVFAHAMYQNKEIYDAVVRKYQQAQSVYVETTECTQMPTRHQTLLANLEPLVTSTAQSITQSASNFASSPTPTGFSDHSEYGIFEQQGVIDYNENFVDNVEAVKKYYGSELVSTSSSEYMPGATPTSTANSKDAATPEHDTLIPSNYKNIMKEKNMDMTSDREPMSYTVDTPAGDEMTTTMQTIALAYGDIVTNPLSEVVFKSARIGEKATITMTNVSNMNIMWALKTNALNRIQAHPVCGTIGRGECVEVKLAIAMDENFDHLKQHPDKIAIDYILMEGNTPFEREFFSRDDKKRHRFHVTYVNS